jgi:hypothetical protein
LRASLQHEKSGIQGSLCSTDASHLLVNAHSPDHQ